MTVQASRAEPDAKALVEAILETRVFTSTDGHTALQIKLAVIGDTATRLAVLLAERDAAVVAALENAECTFTHGSLHPGLTCLEARFCEDHCDRCKALARVKGAS